MKKFRLILGVVFAVAVFMAFSPSFGDKYPFGERMGVVLISADTVEVTPNNLTLTYAMMAMDTSAVINVDTDNSIAGDRIVLEFTADASNRVVKWNTNITAVTDSVLAEKTKLFEFVFNGNAFLEVSENQIN